MGASTVSASPEVAGLMYHEVTDDPTTSGFQRPGALPYTLTRAAFASHLHAIAGGPLKPELVTDVDLIQGASDPSCPRDGVIAMDVLRTCTLLLGRSRMFGRCSASP